MSTTLDVVAARCKRRLAIPDDASDPVWSDDLFLDLANEKLREAAEVVRGWREEFTLNLSGSSPLHTLSNRITRLTDETLRVDYDGSGNFTVWPRLEDEQALRRENGPLESVTASVPYAYYTKRADTVDAMLQLVLFPQSDTARTNGIKFSAEVYPVALTSTSDTLPVQQGEERFFIAGMLYGCAQVLFNQGRADGAALTGYWRGQWEQALTDWEEAVERSLSGTRRRVQFTDTSIASGSATWPW